ncbi:SDR family oxidoreductase [Achromobacter kerstersii]|jgi:NAD(P)-dependent dehydrogenase (short-subunit alcohol dehydrogenase family)|uniref:3-oxoacyl-[acyl-carrier-protein] reductase FabG n=1 Tax=Achromobacter kerstersii TaxID=1353890 RepID=A0A6S6Z338_9BURK|nr:SDR family oxidoreductase [Achromobacter kerstersii]CAB3659970.1 3-oxoacyl-[acyl-carrier-protein] reductase FabG [Achromobacter kerstersii]
MSHTPDSLAGKTALVTGGSRGIGRAIALALGRRGAHVAVHYNAARDAADEVVALIRDAGGRAWTLQADLASSDAAAILAEALRHTVQQHTGADGLDILVNNAGVGLRARLADVKPDDFDRVLQVNLKTPFFLIQHCLPFLRDGGRIVNISSMGTRAAYPEMSVYAPAKAGLEALTLLLASDLGARGITVNAVLPGATATDMNTRARDPDISRAIAQTIALGRVGQPEDIADIVAFLASHEGRWVTGQSIDATGGQRL